MKRSLSRAVVGEVRSVLQQAWLMARAPARDDVVGDVKRAVVLVHGFMAQAPVLGPLGDSIRKELGLPVLSYEYPFAWSFERIARGFAEKIEATVPKTARLSIVGHSLGGLVGRWYVQELGGASRVDRVITLATPHNGSDRARFAPVSSQAAALHPKSTVVRMLIDGGNREGLPPLTSIVAELDHIAPPRPPEGMRGARTHHLLGIGHNGLLFDPRAHRLVLDALRD